MSNPLKTHTAAAGLLVSMAFVSPTHAAGTDMGGGMMNGMTGPMRGE